MDSVKNPGSGYNQKDYFCLCEQPEVIELTGTCRTCTKPVSFKREPKKGHYNFNKKGNELF